MAEKDISGRAVDTAAARLQGAQKKLKAMFPLGPGQVQMQPWEVRRTLNSPNLAPGMLKQVMDRLGPEQALKVLLGTTSAAPTGSLDQFLKEEES